MTGEAGLEAGDGGDVANGATEPVDAAVDDISSATSQDDDIDSDDSSNSNDLAPTHHFSGIENSSEDKAIMMKVFLEGTDSPSATFSSSLNQQREDDPPEKQTRFHSKVEETSQRDFATPPTKLLQRAGTAIPVLIVSGADVEMQNPNSSSSQTIQEADVSLPASPDKRKPVFERQSSAKISASSKKSGVADALHHSVENNESEEGGSSWSQRNQRDRKMIFIIILCASAFVIYNAATYLYLSPVKVGSAPFVQLKTLLELQAQLDLPKSRFLPTLLHVAQLMNPFLSGLDRISQQEDLSKIIIEFKTSLSKWQNVYTSRAELEQALGDELAIGTAMYPPCSLCSLTLSHSSHIPISLTHCCICQVESFELLHLSIFGIWAICPS